MKPWDGTSAANEPYILGAPTVAPATILTVTATGDDSGITAVADPSGSIAATTLIKWAIDGVVVETTQSLVYRFTTDSTGADLVDGQTYLITAQPWNAIGNGTVSAAAVGKLNSGVASQTVLGWVAAGFLLAGTIQVGQMTLSPPTADDPGGLKIPLTNGGLIQLPADGSDAIITAVLRARSLVVENNLRVQGTLNAIEGGLQLANGTTAPTVKPRAGTSWDHAAASLTTNIAPVGNLFGLADGGGSSWYTTESINTGHVWAFSKTTGARTLALNDVADYKLIGGLCRIGTDWYVLAFKNSTFEWFVRKYDSSWVFQSQWKRADNNAFTGTAMAIATDGTFIYTAYRNLASGVLTVFRHNPDGTGGAFIFTSAVVPSGSITSLYVGAADFGATRYVITTTTTVYVFNGSGTRQTAQEWTPANGEQIRGLLYDGTRFQSLGPGGKVWHYATVPAASSLSITHTWYDNDAGGTGTHETEASPALTYAQKPRQWLRVDTDPPSFAGFPDDPNAVRIYIANQRQADLGTGVTSVVYDVPATGGSAAPTSNGFAGISAPGNLTSGATGTGGALTKFDGSGAARAALLIQSGTVTGNVVSAGVVVSVAVTFTVPFTGTPQVTMSPITTGPNVWSVSPSSITSTGFTAYFSRATGTGAVTATWIATTAA